MSKESQLIKSLYVCYCSLNVKIIISTMFQKSSVKISLFCWTWSNLSYSLRFLQLMVYYWSLDALSCELCPLHLFHRPGDFHVDVYGWRAPHVSIAVYQWRSVTLWQGLHLVILPTRRCKAALREIPTPSWWWDW